MPEYFLLVSNVFRYLAGAKRGFLVRILSRRRLPAGPIQMRGLVCICMGDVDQRFIRAAMRLPKPDLGFSPLVQLCPAAGSDRSVAERHPVCPELHNSPAHTIPFA